MKKSPTSALALILALFLAVALAAGPALAQTRKGKGKAAPEIVFDPRAYTMEQYVKEMEGGKSTDLAGIAVFWAIGFMAGKDEALVQKLDEKLLERMMFKYLLVGQEKPKLNFLEATKEVMRLSAELNKPAAAPAAPAPAQQ